MRDLSLVLIGFGLLILQAAVSILVPMHSYAPNLMLPIAIALGVSPDVHIVRGAAVCFVLGYLLDGFCGSPMGLQTFVLVASFMAARGAGVRLFPQGLAFQVLLTFVMALVAGGTVLALRAIFERPGPSIPSAGAQNAWVLFKSAGVTSLAAPVIFGLVRRVEGITLSRADERPSTS